LIEGALVEGFPGAGGPLDLASATIYVPTQRAAAALARALLEASGGISLILPRIAPLGAFEPTRDELGFAEPVEMPSEIAPPAVGELTRRMTLARLTRAWGEALRGAICRVEADGRKVFDESEPALVATSPAQAYALAGDLAALIDDLIIEGVDPQRLDNLVTDNFDPYWRITLDFLKIAFAQWPAWLAERGLIDHARRGALLVENEIRALALGSPRGPTIIAGSTGANRATARLIAAIARAPQGAVVLPDLDLSLDERAWAMIGAGDDGALDVAGHPQAVMRRLIGIVGISRDKVKTLGTPAGALRARAHYLSEALRPADSTDAWSGRREDPRAEALSDEAIASGLADVAIVVAEDENEEALALAVAMREALETPGKTAALITPDVAIARRVSAELARWGVEVEDSAGRTLGQTGAGVFARLALAAAKDFEALPLVALFAHPLTRLARAPEALESAARALEIGVFRGVMPPSGLDDIAALMENARSAARDRHAHEARRRLDEDDWRAAEALLRDAQAAAAPLRTLGADAPLGLYIAAHRAALDAFAAHGQEDRAGEEWGEAHGGEALRELFDEWAEGAELGFTCSLSHYAALFDSVLAGQRAPVGRRAHPRLQILGLLEARLLSFDLALLAGLDETLWPPAAQTDAFLNRPMRASLGLSAPERRIGQTAHDFVAALGARQAIVSRAKKRGGAPTVASRFLQRMGAVAGETATGAAEARGEAYIQLARALDRAAQFSPAPRPTPRPPRALRPHRLSVTRIETLRRDPYAVFAEAILRLNPLEPIGVASGAREVGNLWHAALQEFSEGFAAGPLPVDARERLLAIASVRFQPMLADPSFRAMRWPRIVQGFDKFLSFDAARRVDAERILVERGGRLEIPLADGSIFTLTARADRIELLRGGGAALIDYKSGSPPGAREIQVGFAPQLTLEAAMLSRGGFAGLQGVEAVSALYFKLGGAKGGEARELKFKDATFAEIVERHFVGLTLLLDQFADPSTPYLSRPYPKFSKRVGAYDHLARVKEWSATGGLADDAQGDES
jgi:ATP-dependent helicase/nuclease subunit B